MKKDIVLALCSGALIGALTALLITSLPNLLKEKPKLPETNKDTSVLTNNPSGNPKPPELTILSPDDNTVSENKKIALSGQTQKDNTVVIETDLDNNVFVATNDGRFTVPVSLNEGVNQIYISAYNSQGDTANKNISIFYTVEKL